MTSRALTVVLSLAASLGLAACGGRDADGVACTTEVRTSVLVTVVDVNATPIPNAVVSYQIDGGPSQSLVCPATGACPVGQEQAGRFTMTVSRAGYLSAAADVRVNRDICHVLTEQIRVVLRTAP